MNPQDLQNLLDAINSLQAAVNQLAGTTGVLSSGMNNVGRSLNTAAPTIQGFGAAVSRTAQNVAQSGNMVQQATGQAANQINAQTQAMNQAASGLKNAVFGMVQSLTNASGSLSNLTGAGNVLGRVVTSLGVSMGANAAKAAAFGQALSTLIGTLLGNTQAYLEAKNSLNKLGAVGEQTVSSLYAYAHAAGLYGDTINYMIGPMRQLGTSISGLGRGAGDAQKAFMEMLQVGEDARSTFARVGIMQEEMMSRQGDFVSAMDAAGVGLRNQYTDMNKLRAASTQYISNLYELASLTGQNVDEIRDRQKAALDDRRVALDNMISQSKINRLLGEAAQLESENTEESKKLAAQKRAEAESIRADMEAKNKFIMALQDAPQALQQGVKQMLYGQGAITGPESESLAMLGLGNEVNRLADELKKGGDSTLAAQRLIDEYTRAIGRQAEVLGPSAQLAPTEDLAKRLSLGKEEAQFYGRNQQRERENELLRNRLNQALAASEKGADAASRLAAQLQETSIRFNQALENAANKANPLIESFDLLKDSATAAAQALRGISGIAEGIESTLKGTRASGEAVDKAANQLGNLLSGVGLPSGIDPNRTVFGKEQNLSGPPAVESKPGQEIGSSWMRPQRVPPLPVPGTQQPGTPPTTAPTPEAQTPAAPTTGAQPPAAPGTGTPPTTTPERPETLPATTPGRETPEAQAPETPPQGQPPATTTPLPRYQPVKIKTNLGNTITISEGGVGKIAEFLRKNNDRAVLRAAVRQITKLGTDYNDSTIDKIIDAAAGQANLPIPAGSKAEEVTAVTPAQPTVQPPTQLPEGTQAPTAPQTRPPATTTPTAPQTRPPTTTTTAPQAAAPTTPQVTTPAQTIRYTERQKQWVVNQLKAGKTAEQIRTELLKNGYKPDQANAVISAAQKSLGTTTTTAPQTQTQPEPPRAPERTESRPSVGTQTPTPSTTATTVQAKPQMQKVTLEQLAEQGLGRFFRGPQGEGQGKFDTQRAGAEVDTRLINAAQKLTQADLSPFTLRNITALNDNYHQRFNWKNNPHKEGRAIDFTLNKTPSPKEFERLKPKLTALGFDTIKDRYNNFNAGTDSGRHIHAEFDKLTREGLEKGGIVMGSKQGFPAKLHGNEIVVPLDPNSVLAELGKKSAEQIKTEMSVAEKSFKTETTTEAISDMGRMNRQLMEMLSGKLDDVIRKLETSNDTQDKLLRHTQV